MATIPTVQVWSTGQFVTASQMNAGIGNVLSWLMSPPRAIVYRNTAQARASSTTAVAAIWTTELVDTDTMWTVSSPTRLTCHTAGLFLIEGAAHFDGVTTGTMLCGIGVNTGGSWSVPNKLQESTVPATGTSFGESISLCFSYFLNSGDYLELFIGQTSGSTINAFPGGAYFDGHLGARWFSSS